MNKQTIEMNNRSTIEGLRAMADWLEAHPNFPAIQVRTVECVWCKTELLAFIPELGPFEKQWTEDELRIIRHFSTTVRLSLYINREKICTKQVVWTCPDEGLLELAKEIAQP